MSKSKYNPKFPRKKVQNKRVNKVYSLDQLSDEKILKLKDLGDQYIKFHWDYYNDLVYQRSKLSDDIKQALLAASKQGLNFSKWSRVLRYKYSHLPLSVAGSLKKIGGRFNLGDINSPQAATFPALYIAEDFKTGIQEYLSQSIDFAHLDKAYESALAKPNSFTNLILKGKLEYYVDLNEPKRLNEFVNIIKQVKLSDHLKDRAKKIGEKINLIGDVKLLIDTLLIRNWRLWPMQFDVPASSQVFGQLVADAGIEAILYPSQFTGKNCMAIFLQNFPETDSCIRLEDDSPPGVKIKHVDGAIWKKYQNEIKGM